MIKISNLFYPKFKCDLIRLGKNFDGGYIVERNSIKNSEILLSFGLSDDWTFEEAYSNLGNNKIYCYDYSVNTRFWFVNFIKSVLNILLLRDPLINFQKLFNYVKYKTFFNSKKNFHHKKFISPNSMKKNLFDNNVHTSLNDIANKIEKNFFLKIDIEGSEYRILNEILENSSKINGLVIEFHDFDLHYTSIQNFINKFELELIHIHVNNYGIINKDGLPSVVELSFASSNFFEKNKKNDKSYPDPNLDMPNNKELIDNEISFY